MQWLCSRDHISSEKPICLPAFSTENSYVYFYSDLAGKANRPGVENFGSDGPVSASILGVYRNPDTKLTTSSNLVVSAAGIELEAGFRPNLTLAWGPERLYGSWIAAALRRVAPASGAVAAQPCAEEPRSILPTRARTPRENGHLARCAAARGCCPSAIYRVSSTHQSVRRGNPCLNIKA
jgi:hypothetical protein